MICSKKAIKFTVFALASEAFECNLATDEEEKVLMQEELEKILANWEVTDTTCGGATQFDIFNLKIPRTFWTQFLKGQTWAPDGLCDEEKDRLDISAFHRFVSQLESSDDGLESNWLRDSFSRWILMTLK